VLRAYIRYNPENALALWRFASWLGLDMVASIVPLDALIII